RRRRMGIAAAAAIALGLAFLVGRSTAPVRVPGFKRLTPHRGPIGAARFTPDGRTVVYSSVREVGPPLLFSTRVDAPGGVARGLPPAVVLAISSTGQVALRLSRDADPSSGTLAQVTLGGTDPPRELLGDVQDASWAPDGRRLCVLRSALGAGQQLEFPAGE